MARAGDLEERPVLLPERDLAVVEEPRDEREPEIVDGLAEVDLALALDHAQRAYPLITRRTCADGRGYGRTLGRVIRPTLRR